MSTGECYDRKRVDQLGVNGLVRFGTSATHERVSRRVSRRTSSHIRIFGGQICLRPNIKETLLPNEEIILKSGSYSSGLRWWNGDSQRTKRLGSRDGPYVRDGCVDLSVGSQVLVP